MSMFIFFFNFINLIMENIYVENKKIKQFNIESDFHQFFDSNGNIVISGDVNNYDCGFLNIDKLIECLQDLKKDGGHYTTIDWHNDHQD